MFFLVFYPLKIKFLRFFLHHFVGLIQKDPTLRFWVKAFQNQWTFWWKNPLTDCRRHFFSGISPLRPLWPAIDGETEIVKILLSNGAAADKEDNQKLTPIYHAAVKNHFDIVKILCEYNANPIILERNGIPALEKICSDGDLKCVKYLLSKRLDPSEGDSLKVSLELYHQDITRELINAGTDINKVSTYLFYFNCL